MGALLAKIVGLGGVLRGSKTILGVLSLGYFFVSQYKPEFKPLADQIVQALGLALLPIGLADKALRK